MAEDVLFKATKPGERRVLRWVTPKEAIRLRPIYEKDGWTVTTKTVE